MNKDRKDRRIIGWLALWGVLIVMLIVLKICGVNPVAAWRWHWVLAPIWGVWGLGLLAYCAHCLVGLD